MGAGIPVAHLVIHLPQTLRLGYQNRGTVPGFCQHPADILHQHPAQPPAPVGGEGGNGVEIGNFPTFQSAIEPVCCGDRGILLKHAAAAFRGKAKGEEQLQKILRIPEGILPQRAQMGDMGRGGSINPHRSPPRQRHGIFPPCGGDGNPAWPSADLPARYHPPGSGTEPPGGAAAGTGPSHS